MKRIRKALIGAATLVLSLSTTAQQSWFPSKFGPADGLGAANYLTPAIALEAAKLVKTGKTYSLGITGWLSLVDKDPMRFGSVEPGLGRDGARYLVSNNIVAVGADTWALEAIPFEKDAGVCEVRHILLPMNGTYILENINTAELAKDKAWEFMFALGQNKYPGAVQSMIHPVAIG